jgi:hypothetical protein
VCLTQVDVHLWLKKIQIFVVFNSNTSYYGTSDIPKKSGTQGDNLLRMHKLFQLDLSSLSGAGA